MKFKNFIKIIILCVSIGVTAFSAEQTDKVENKNSLTTRNLSENEV